MRPRPDNQLHELIGQVYEAAFDDVRWSRVGCAIAAAFHAASARLRVMPPQARSHLLDAGNGSGQVVAPFAIFCWQRDVWERSHPGPAAACSDDCADWCRRPEVHYVLGAEFPLGAMELGQLHIHRRRDDGHYQPGERNRIAALLPHLRRAMQLRKRVDQVRLAEQVSAAALDNAALATFVVDAELTLLHANPQARSLLHHGDVLRLARGRLVQLAPHNGAPLAQLVRAAIEGAALHHRPPPHWLRIGRGAGRPPLTLTVAPLPPGRTAATPQPLALILLRDPEQVSAPVRALQQLFDLTPAEAGVAQALSAGAALDQVAQALLISPNTVKTHLHRIFDKTGTRRQGELIALIHSSIATGGLRDSELKNNNVIHLNDAAHGLTDYTDTTGWR